MRLFISADIEGVAGITAREQAGPQGFEYTAARQLMTNEVLAVVRGARAAGVRECVVCDAHGNGLSILADQMPEDMLLVRSWPRPLLMMQGIEHGDYVGAVLLGYHAGAGCVAGTMAHTLSSRGILGLRLNGQEADEAYVSAATAAAFGVPLLMMSGDDAFIAASAPVLRPLETVVTKRTCGMFSAMSPAPQVVCEALEAAAARAVTRRADANPMSPGADIEVELTLVNRLAAELLDFLPLFERVGANGVRFRVADMPALNRTLSFLMFYNAV